MQNAPLPLRLLLKLFGKPPETAGEALAYLALAPEFAGTTGKFFKGRAPIAPDPYALDRATQHRLWHETGRLGGLATVLA